MNIVFLVGLPGSGKTTLYNESYPEYAFVDDPRELATVRREVMAAWMAGKDIVISDPHLTREDVRKLAESSVKRWLGDKDHEIHWVFFENDPEAAQANVKRRNDQRGDINVYAMSRLYTIPEGVMPLRIWRPNA